MTVVEITEGSPIALLPYFISQFIQIFINNFSYVSAKIYVVGT